MVRIRLGQPWLGTDRSGGSWWGEVGHCLVGRGQVWRGFRWNYVSVPLESETKSFCGLCACMRALPADAQGQVMPRTLDIPTHLTALSTQVSVQSRTILKLSLFVEDATLHSTPKAKDAFGNTTALIHMRLPPSCTRNSSVAKENER